MTTVDYIKKSLEMAKSWAMGPIIDMKDAPLTQPTSKGGNHPLWVLGHITYSESDILDGLILGKPNRFPELKENFSMGTTPTTDANQYPSMDELLPKFEEITAATMAYLDSIQDKDLDKKSFAPEELGDIAGTVGACLMILTNHRSYHAGQVADARRAAGRPVLMA